MVKPSLDPSPKYRPMTPEEIAARGARMREGSPVWLDAVRASHPALKLPTAEDRAADGRRYHGAGQQAASPQGFRTRPPRAPFPWSWWALWHPRKAWWMWRVGYPMMRQVEDFEQRHFPHDRASAVVFRGELLSRYYFDELWLLPAFVQESLIDDSEWKVFVEHNCGLVVQREGLRWRSSTPDCWTLDFEFTEPALHGWDNTVRLNGQRLLANWTQVLAWFRNWQAQASFTFHTVDTVPDWLLRAVEKEQGSLG